METDVQAKAGRLRKPNNVFVVPATAETDIFKLWCDYLRPMVDLTPRELEVLASLLRHRWELSKHITDQSILDANVLNKEAKEAVLKDCNMTNSHLNVILSSLRKHKVIVDNTIHPRMVPNLRENEGVFQLVVLIKEPTAKVV